MLLTIVLGSSVASLVLVVYLLYFFLVYGNKASISKYLTELSALREFDIKLPKTTVIINTFNEAKVIRRKLENISKMDYPKENMGVIVVDDCSSDDTGDVAKQALADYKLNGRILRNPVRIGLNASLNIAFQEAANDVICVTDSDVMLEKSALKRAVRVLKGFDGAGGVTGKIEPVLGECGVASSSEGSYRAFYDRSMLSESSLHSCFPGNGPLIVFDRSLVRFLIPVEYGSSDANIAVNVIKSGKRLLYVPDAVIFEPVPDTVGQQRLQKVRRARRLIQAFLHNRDIFCNKAYGKFGTLIFPLKFLMHVVCPLLMVSSMVSIMVGVLLSGDLLFQLVFASLFALLACVLLVWRHARSFFFSFVLHQSYLLSGLFSSFQKSVFWKTIERK